MQNHSKTRKQARPCGAIVVGKQPLGKKKVNRRVSKIQKASLKKAGQINRSGKARQRMKARGLNEQTLRRVSKSAFGALLHHKQVLSIALVALGVVYAVKMTIHAIGTAMAGVRGAIPKHGIKQVDRFMSNDKLKPVDLRRGLVRLVVGDRKKIEVSMDWTDFDKDDQTTLVISLVLKHGRAIPLIWLNERKSSLKDKRSMHERTAAWELRQALPDDVRVLLLADRGFGDTKFFDHLSDIPGFDFIIRFKKCYLITASEYVGKAQDAVFNNGRIRILKNALLTGEKRWPYIVVLYKANKMKDSWCLATNLDTSDGSEIVSAYGRRFECEESFRDLKDWRFGMALKYTQISDELRRDRLLFAFVLAAYLLTLVGAVSEKLGFDRLLRANTSNRRTHSLFRQGREIVKEGALPEACERECLRLSLSILLTALERGLCHAFS